MQPVDVKTYEDYLNFVSEPMDLGKIKQKLTMLEYLDASSFAADVRLVFNNCKVQYPAQCNGMGGGVNNSYSYLLPFVFAKKPSAQPCV